IARELVVTKERDRTKDPMMMPRRLACSDRCGSAGDAFHDATRDLGFIDEFDQNVALCTQPNHLGKPLSTKRITGLLEPSHPHLLNRLCTCGDKPHFQAWPLRILNSTSA